MAEYIDREALLKAMSYHNYYPKGKHFLKGIETAEEIIEHFPAADVQPVKWIPVTERLPEEYKNVLCYYEYFRFGEFNCMFRTIDRGYYGNGIWGGEAGQGLKNKVLAWMPLPEPPKDKDGEL